MSRRTDLPSGTVTFMFTDIEGSTGLLNDLGPDAYGEALAEHRRIVRETIDANGGVEVDTQGDAFFVAFPTASGAIAAADKIVELLGAGPIRLRIGIHTGTPILIDEGYVGEDVHRAARIAAAGHGGQVLVSRTTATLVGTEFRLRDLGEHRLKDLAGPERIYQLGDETFPPLRSQHRSNLPIPATAFLGRERELAEVTTLLERDDVRLLTLTGPGGTGKTRLGIQAAAVSTDRYPDGIWWVPLAPLRDPHLVVVTASQVVGASNGLADHIADRAMLLVLDNFEQVIDAADDVAGILAACPHLEILVTSRERLAIPGEQAYPVPPLAPPEGAELFIARARSVDPGFAESPLVTELCDRLDNLPLAIELAACCVGSLSPGQVLERLSARLDLLKGGRGIAARQRTLRATIEWSHDLLSDEERQLFARLAVFRGGCTLEAAEEIADADIWTLAALVDKSLLRHSDGRYWMLDTIAAYAAERLAASVDAEAIRRRHAEWFLALAETANLSILSVGRGPQRHELVMPEEHNMRAASDWATDVDVELALRLSISLENFWLMRDPAGASQRLATLLARSDGIDAVLRAQALMDYGGCLQFAGQPERATDVYEQSLTLFREVGDERGALTAVFRLGTNAAWLGDSQKARRLYADSLAGFQRIGDPIGELQVLGNLAALEMADDPDRSRELTRRSLQMARSAGWTWWEGGQIANLAEHALRQGKNDEAEPFARDALALARRIGDRIIMVYGLGQMAWLAAENGNTLRASRLWRAIEAEEARQRIPEWAADRELYAAHVGPVDPTVPAMELEEAVDYALGV